MRIGVFGLGYVGAVTVACMAEMGHEVIGVDINPKKVATVLDGRGPVIEPGLDELLGRHVRSGRVTASVDGEEVAADCDVAIIAVGTPSTASGGIDPTFLFAVADQIGRGFARNPRDYVSAVNRSTSLPAVHGELAAKLVEASGRQPGVGVGYACHPEFLRETTAIADFFDPPVIVFGCDEPATLTQCRAMYTREFEAPTVEVDVGEAAMVKYAANCYHAVKVTFANEIGELCRNHGIDARTVMDIFAMDDKLNISSKYLMPGNPFGGSCLPKDLRAVLDAAREEAIVVPMLQGTLLSNVNQIDALSERILARRPTKVAIVGLAFKEGTDDLREAPLVPVAERLIGKGIDVAIFDEELAVEELTGANRVFALDSIPHLADLVSNQLSDVVEGADLVVVNHKLDAGVEWSALIDEASTAVLDLVGVPGLRSFADYEGLFWGGQDAPDVVQL
ncbi:MAG: nucleotide sugar dehydrogenase [Actinomycetota bacterium]